MRPLIAAALLAAVGAPAAAQADWDSDGDGRLSRAEFDAGIGDIFHRYDQDDDRRIGPEDAAALEPLGLDWSSWDQDGDGLLTGAEFAAGVFAAYDSDQDGALSGAEMGDAPL